MQEYPMGSQSNKETDEVLILVRLFDIRTKTNYRLSEYGFMSKTASGYITTPS